MKMGLLTMMMNTWMITKLEEGEEEEQVIEIIDHDLILQVQHLVNLAEVEDLPLHLLIQIHVNHQPVSPHLTLVNPPDI